MIARLSRLSTAAEPTPFHQVLHALDERGKLLRVYTQNIDAIESKSGLSLGVPVTKPRTKAKEPLAPPESASGSCDSAASSPPPDYGTPRCIPLHGTLQSMHCQSCTFSFPLKDHLTSLTFGTPPDCPECVAMNDTRSMVGKRPLSVGKLRPSVVLYNEIHKDGEVVGEVVRKDLVGGSKGKGRAGADLLLVVGTSLRVPGTKRIVREFAKAVRSRSSPTPPKEFGSGSSSPSLSPRRSPTRDEEPPLKSIYLNFDFPVPTREWEGVFDVWLQGDAQSFAQLLQDAVDKELMAKELTKEKKRKRDEEAVMATLRQQEVKRAKKGASTPSSSTTKKRQTKPMTKKRKPVTTALLKPSADRPDVHEKIFLRIPSANARRTVVPEVFISTVPPLTGKKGVFPRPTPTRIVDPGGKPVTRVKGDPHLSTYLRRTMDYSGDESSELSDLSDELPTPCTRLGPGQYGLPDR